MGYVLLKLDTMKTIKYIFLILLVFQFTFSCDETEAEDEEPERLTVLLTLNNNRGASGCNPPYDVTFVINYRDIQAIVDVGSENTAFLNALVEDGESINVQVRRTSDDTVVADANVSVRTTSRPDNLEDSFRTISFCKAFDLSFQNF